MFKAVAHVYASYDFEDHKHTQFEGKGFASCSCQAVMGYGGGFLVEGRAYLMAKTTSERLAARGHLWPPHVAAEGEHPDPGKGM